MEYIPYISHIYIYVLNIFLVFSFVCFSENDTCRFHVAKSLSTGLRPPRHRALTAISILDMAFAVEPVVWATSQNLNDHAWCNVHASPLDQAGVGPRTASVYIYDGVKKSENGGTIFVAKSLVLKKY